MSSSTVNLVYLSGHNVMWTLFNGESFDYIGSQRVAYEMSLGAWPAAAPLAPAQLALHLELGQLGGAFSAAADTAWPLTAFAPYTGDVPQQVRAMLTSSTTYLTRLGQMLLPETCRSRRYVSEYNDDESLPAAH